MEAVLLFLFGAGIYLLPTWIVLPGHHLRAPVVLVNVLLGWTLVGWVVALVMAFLQPRPQYVAYGPPPRQVSPRR
jgi:hypothetical protein